MSGFKKILLAVFLPVIFVYSQTEYLYKIPTKEKKLPFGLTQKVSTLTPKISLVLSGGGARGFAQIGVLKVLENYNIPIENITATSIGSIVGGLYAAGFNADELDSIAANTDWQHIASTDRETERRELFIDQKITEDRAVLALRLKGLTPIIPNSINNGQKLTNFLNLITLKAPIHVRDNFDELLYPYSAVCTDLVSGNAVILNKGSLSLAMRASSSISFYLAPVKYDTLTLVDGGLVANVPVNIAKHIAPDYIVAVNTTSPLHTKEDLDYPWQVADQVISIPLRLLTNEQLKGANIIISPEIGQQELTDFSSIDSLISAGYNSTLPYINRIKNDLDSIFITRLKKDETFFHNLTLLADADEIEKRFYANFLTSNDSISSSKLLESLNRLYETGDFEYAYLQIIKDSVRSRVKLNYLLNPIIKHINVKEVTLFKLDDVYQIVDRLSGSCYNPKKIMYTLIDLLTLYRKKGYALADVTECRFNAQTGELNISLDEGRIDKIEIHGAVYTVDDVILRELSIKKGEVFLDQKMSRGLNNLKSTNLFDNVMLSVRKDSSKNIVVVNLVERTSSVLRLGFRVDNEYKAQFNIDIRDENIFGRNAEFGVNLLGGELTRGIIVEAKSNRIYSTYFMYKFNLYYRSLDVSYYNHFNSDDNTIKRVNLGQYRQSYYGASFSLGTQVERFGNIIFKGMYENNEVIDISTDGLIKNHKDKIVSLRASATIDTQDKYPYPNSGTYFNGNYETAQKILGGEVGYSNFWFDYKQTIPINSIQVLVPRIMMGFADKTTPLTQQFSLGGQNTFFGMYENEYRGRQVFLTSLEYRIKSPVDIFFKTYLRLRYDLGSVWEQQDKIKFSELKHGAGVTVSLDTPIGPADFSIGQSFTIKKDLPNPIVHAPISFYFSIGYYY